jgi:sec-independent protein translocase protein TatA
MGTFSIWHWLILLLIVMLLFGRGKISEIMGDVAKGIKSVKKGMSDDEEAAAGAQQQPKPADPKVINHAGGKSTEQTKTEESRAG